MAVAGIYQREDFLRIADVARDLQFCLEFPDPPRNASWTPALLAILADVDGSSADSATPLIILDGQQMSPFPSPPQGQVDRYTYVHHDRDCATSASPHRLADPCIYAAKKPTRRRHPAYLPIGKRTESKYLVMTPLRKIKSLKRQNSTASSLSPSPSPSPSPTRTPSPTKEDQVEYYPSVIDLDVANSSMNEFRAVVMSKSQRCAISGEGESWLTPGRVGPGVQAAHIVPQIHWNVYPLDMDQSVADVRDNDQLKDAWLRTWSSTNGLALLVHLHICFDARLISIHPRTRRIRSFVGYDVLVRHHGKRAHVPDVDPAALQYHWDMCCIENMVAPWVQDAPEPLQSMGPPPAISQPRSEAYDEGNTTGDPVKPPAGGQSSVTPRSGSVAPSSETRFEPVGRLPSPSLSDQDVRGTKRWSCGPLPVENAKAVAEPTRHDFLVSADDDDDSGGSNSGSDTFRGRPLKRRHCTATQSDAHPGGLQAHGKRRKGGRAWQ